MQIFVYLFLFILISCGSGIDQISHTGNCDGYTDWETSDYNLPWAAGVNFKVSQGNCGVFTHLGAHRYAYDIPMDIGTEILAIRDGVVLEIEESYDDGNGCPDANTVKIEHADGSVGAYFHLTKNGALVDKGDVVIQGDIIARSGNTGCSTDPHLHLIVFDNAKEENSIPITFRNTSKNPRGLRSNTSYTAQ